MGSKTSKTKRSASVETKTAATSTAKIPAGPRVPQEIVDEILDHLVADSDSRSLRSCSLASKFWVQRCRGYLFHTILFTSALTTKWLETFPVPEESPAHHVRDLRFVAGGGFNVPERFFEYVPWFTKVERVTVSGFGGWETLCRILSLGAFPQSVTSLAINAGIVNLLQIRNILAQLQNLNDLSLSRSHVTVDREALPGIGSILRGNFGGRLRLHAKHAAKEVINTLLEVPTGLHFTEVEVIGVPECLVSTVRLAEACGRNLVKLTYSIDPSYGWGDFDRCFDFSKLPRLREVKLGLHWIQGGAHWIPVALSTINPVTSLHLAVVHLDLAGPRDGHRTPETWILGLGNDLRRTTNEVNRIRSEFDGGIDVVVFQDQWFRALFDSLNLTV